MNPATFDLLTYQPRRKHPMPTFQRLLDYLVDHSPQWNPFIDPSRAIPEWVRGLPNKDQLEWLLLHSCEELHKEWSNYDLVQMLNERIRDSENLEVEIPCKHCGQSGPIHRWR